LTQFAIVLGKDFYLVKPKAIASINAQPSTTQSVLKAQQPPEYQWLKLTH